MSRSSKQYAYFVSAAGLILGSYCVYLYLNSIWSSLLSAHELAQFLVLFFLYIVCRCFPIYIRDDYAIDMSFICNLATIICQGPVAAAAMVLLSTPFVVVRSNTDERTFYHIFNKPPIKTAFNAANYIISVYVAGSMYQKAGGIVGSTALPAMILPGIVLIFCFFFLNCGLLLMLFHLDEKIPFFRTLLQNLAFFLPNVAASAPIGYFIAQFMQMENGEYLVLLFMLPLMLARYSFVLYLDVKQNYYNMVKTLTAALEAKDKYTEGHSHRVEEYAEKIARRMYRPQGYIESIKVAALLHDIGKIGIDEHILNKPGPLTQEEREVIMKHPQISANILKNVKLNPEVRTMILHHHERYDGTGYPDHTKGSEIPIDVYIIGVADAYDAMTSRRPYSPTLTDEQVVEVLKRESGKQFHPKVVEAFLEVLRDMGKNPEGGGKD